MQKPFSNPIFWISILGNIVTIVVALGVVNWMGGYRQFMSRLKNRGLSSAYEMDKSQQNILHNKEVELLFLGNSLIANGLWDEWFPNKTVANRGIRGDGIEGVLNRLEPISKAPPQKLILLIGINDLAFHNSDWVLEKYQLLLKELKHKLPTTKVVVQSILPVNNYVKDTGLSNDSIRLINNALRELVLAEDYKWIDLHPLFSDEQGNLKQEWTLDGLHLSGIAYKNWVELLNTKLRTAHE